MKLESIVSISDIESTRLPAEFVAWFDSLLTQIHESDDDELSKEVFLRNTNLSKRFYEELFPLFALLEKKKDEWTDVKITPALGYQNYDAKVESSDPDHPEWLEITYVILGRDYKLRMEYFLEHGFTSMTGPVEETNTSSGRRIRIIKEAKLAEDTIKEVSSLIEERIKKKAEKEYPPKTGFIIWVEDYGTFRKEKNFNRLKELIDDNYEAISRSFSHTYLILSSNGAIYEKGS